MTILVVGASGATGRWVVEQLLERGLRVRAVVRSPEKLPPSMREHDLLSLVHADLLDLSDEEMVQQVSGCTAVVSCLGHNMTLRGIYGAPRRLVTEATRRLCEAIRATRPARPVRFVLMNTAGNRDRDLDGPVSFGERCIVGLIRLLLPPHVDNEAAADHLRTRIGQDATAVEWVIVRPDTLIDAPEVSAYEVHPSPTRSAIFDAGKTRRVNVAHFMVELVSDDAVWKEWKGRMPVIYDEGFA